MRSTRRGFLTALRASIAGATLDPERLLWRPGKLISIPKPNAGMAVRLMQYYDPVRNLMIGRLDAIGGQDWKGVDFDEQKFLPQARATLEEAMGRRISVIHLRPTAFHLTVPSIAAPDTFEDEMEAPIAFKLEDTVSIEWEPEDFGRA